MVHFQNLRKKNEPFQLLLLLTILLFALQKYLMNKKNIKKPKIYNAELYINKKRIARVTYSINKYGEPLAKKLQKLTVYALKENQAKQKVLQPGSGRRSE